MSGGNKKMYEDTFKDTLYNFFPTPDDGHNLLEVGCGRQSLRPPRRPAKRPDLTMAYRTQ